MLHQFLATHRSAVLEKSAAMSASQSPRSMPQSDSYGRISIFLDQLIDILRLEELAAAMPANADGAGAPPPPVPTVEMARSAAAHGRELRSRGFTIEEVVRNYGGMCQAITTLAMEENAGIEVAEFRSLNRCLDEGIAQAVVAFTSPDLQARSPFGAAQQKDATPLDGLAAMYHHIETARAAVQALRTGRVGIKGATGSVLDRSLNCLSWLVDDALKKAG